MDLIDTLDHGLARAHAAHACAESAIGARKQQPEQHDDEQYLEQSEAALAMHRAQVNHLTRYDSDRADCLVAPATLRAG